MSAAVLLTLEIDSAASAAMRQSLASVGDALDALNGVSNHVLDLLDRVLMGGDNSGDLVRIEAAGVAAGGAVDLQCLKILPGDRYLELVTAIAGQVQPDPVRLVHGWPILSPPQRAEHAPTVAETGAGGQAAARSGDQPAGEA